MIIALHGTKGAGKDYFYQVLSRRLPDLVDVRKIAFADPIKKEVSSIFQLQTEEEYDYLKRSDITCTRVDGSHYNVPGRDVVRGIGMLMRSYDDTQFVRYVHRAIDADPDAVWCITDLRFENELNFLHSPIMMKNHKVWVVKILRSGFGYDGHATEQEIADDYCNVIINNDGTIEEYEEKVIKTYDILSAFSRQGTIVI